MKARIITALFFMPFLLCSCNAGWNLDRLKSAEPQGTEFQKYLAKEYLKFSQSEAEEYDWTSSSYFANKGLMAAYGKDVMPENLANWNIPENMLPTLVDAREKLIKALSAENMNKKPMETARAQYLYDCWVEEQEENWETDHINACRDEFFVTLDELNKKEEVKKEPEKIEKPKPEVKKLNYMVNFDFDSSRLGADAKKVISGIATDVDGKKAEVDIVTNGYTDLVGTEKYNLKLSKKRAENVKKELVKNGFDEKKINVYAYGESDPVVNTKKKERKNRRVEIIIKE